MTPYFTMTVCYEDTDAGGVVYHSKYLGFAERARMAFLHEKGLFCKEMASRENPVSLILSRCEIDYKKPAFLEDELTIELEISNVTGVRFECLHRIKRKEELLVEIKAFIACVTPQGRPARMPKDMREKITV